MKTVLALVVVLGLACHAEAVVGHAKADQGFCSNTTNAGNMAAICAATNTTTFTYTPLTTNNAVLFALACAATGGTPSAVSLTATGWTTTQVGGIVGSTTVGWIAVFKAYALNTSAATFTQTWTVTGSSCNNFINDLIDEFSGADGTNFVDNSGSGSGTTGCALSITPVANDVGLWFACNDNVTGSGTYTKGADDTQADWSEWKILSGGAGASQASGWTTSGNFTIFGVSVKPAAGAASPPTRTLLGVGKVAP